MSLLVGAGPSRTSVCGGGFAFLVTLGCGGLFSGGSFEFDGPHTATIQGMDVSPDGKWLATASEDRTVRIWSLPDRKGKRVLPHDDFAGGTAFSPDGARLATAGLDGVRIWSTSTWEQTGFIDRPCFAIDWAGGLLAVAPKDGNSIELYNGATLSRVRALEGHNEPAFALALSEDGALLVSGSRDLTARLWDTAAGKEMQIFAGHKAGVLAVDVSPGGTRVITGSMDKSARVWDAVTGEPVRTLIGHADWVVGVELSADGAVLATVGRDGVVRLWDPANGASVAKMDLDAGALEEVRFSDPQTLIAVGADIHVRGVGELFAEYVPGRAEVPQPLDPRCSQLVRCGVALIRGGGDRAVGGGDVVRGAREMDLRSPELCTTTLLAVPASVGGEAPPDCQP